jgi:phosphotransferase system, enzyme I, PtsP
VPGVKNALSLLKQLRNVMAKRATAQEKLDEVVVLVAKEFSSEVCSVYLLRAGDILELFASVGLNKDSVHLTRLGVGQGLVGEIASTATPLNLADAQLHPKFVYRPETGEEIYSSFVGVPILQHGKVIGVVVVQGREAREYSHEQVEVLQTVAMVLSELAISGQLVGMEELKTSTGGLATQQLTGIRLSSGMARAPAVLHQRHLVITQYVAADIEQEKRRFADAIATLQEAFSQYIHASAQNEKDEQREIIETYILFTQDRGWLTKIDEAISSGLTAEAAVKKVEEELQARLSQVASPYIRERIQDLEDLSDHLLQVLLGKEVIPEAHELPEAFILVARSLSPAELLHYDHTKLKGLILEESSTTSHTAVIARSMDIPALARVERATSIIEAGDMIIVDGDSGNVYVRPGDQIEQAMEQHIRHVAAQAAEYGALKHLEAVTQDGVRISLNVNAGLFVDTGSVLQAGVDGIGLYRTELPYMTSPDFPDVETQRQLYAKMYEQLPGKRIIFRSFDIGGDKKVPYLHIGEEENPAMGWRATRIGIDHPHILRTQFRALIEAAAGQPLYVMFPFIAEVSEFDAVRRLFDQELALVSATSGQGVQLPSLIKIGIMIEIPSILWQLESLMPRLDFVSIGSNDLMQFLFACDRGATRMSDRYDTLSPIMLSVVRSVVTEAAKHNVEVSFCGEMARRPLDALALIGTGIKSLSVAANSIGPLKATIRSASFSELSAYIDTLLASSDASVRHRLADYVRDHRIAI